MLLDEVIERLREHKKVKNYELSSILKTLSNKKFLLPLKQLRNAETFFNLTERFFVDGPKNNEATSEQGYASGYFLDIHDMLHVFNFFSRFQREVSPSFAKLLQARVDSLFAESSPFNGLSNQEIFRLVLSTIRYAG